MINQQAVFVNTQANIKVSACEPVDIRLICKHHKRFVLVKNMVGAGVSINHAVFFCCKDTDVVFVTD